MIVPVMAISNLVLTQQIYSEETNGAHAHYREPVPLRQGFSGFIKTKSEQKLASSEDNSGYTDREESEDENVGKMS